MMQHQNDKVLSSLLKEQHAVGVVKVEPNLKCEEPVDSGWDVLPWMPCWRWVESVT